MAGTTIKVKLDNVPGQPKSGGLGKKGLLLLALVGGGFYLYKTGKLDSFLSDSDSKDKKS